MENKTFKMCPVCGTTVELKEVMCPECGYDYSMSNVAPRTINLDSNAIFTHNGKDIHLEIEDIWINKHEHCPNGVLGIDWSSDIGFGRYELIKGDDNKLHAYTEYMEKDEDKKFTKTILNKLIQYIVTEE